MRRACLILLALPFLFQTTLRGQDAAKSNQDAASLLARLHAADAGSALDTADMKPWHLKMTVQLFDDKGKPSDQGTIEEWWRAPGVERREYKTGTYSETEISTGGKTYRTKDTGTPPYNLELLREQVVHPMPPGSEMDSSTPELRTMSVGKSSLDCIMLSRPLKLGGAVPLGLFPTYCFDPGKAVPRLSFEYFEQQMYRNKIGLFQGRPVALEVVVLAGEVKVAAAQVTTLDEASLPDSSLEPTDDLAMRGSGKLGASSGVVAGLAKQRFAPVYPESAKRLGISGTVVLKAIIGSDGQTHDLQILSAPDVDLAIAAIGAVRQWTYKAYLLAGQPTEVETTINVNFGIKN